MNPVSIQLRKKFKGISWRNPIISLGLHMLDPIDYLLKSINGINNIPKYSVRVRSNGVTNQLGGYRFVKEGSYLSHLLKEYANLASESKVLEIGCGCGRLAVPLASIIKNGNYNGMDIDRESLEACLRNKLLLSKNCEFQLMDIYNGAYNPAGCLADKDYKFPYTDASFDVIYMFSVFTHILPDGVTNYIKEISRLLKAGGRCLFSTFLMDYGFEGSHISFPYAHDSCRLYEKSIPEKAVGYNLDFFDQLFISNDMHRLMEPIIGTWRKPQVVKAITEFSQDILVYEK